MDFINHAIIQGIVMIEPNIKQKKNGDWICNLLVETKHLIKLKDGQIVEMVERHEIDIYSDTIIKEIASTISVNTWVRVTGQMHAKKEFSKCGTIFTIKRKVRVNKYMGSVEVLGLHGNIND